MSHESLWIFGYGSLVWRPAFSHLRRCPAFIDGFARRFWQGSTDHRGVPERPGRVVTLIPDQNESVAGEPGFRAAPCWGTAYEVPVDDPDGVLAGLDHRERGGYDRVELDLTLVDRVTNRAASPAHSHSERVQGLVYVAEPHNENFLGPAAPEEIASQIATASGPSGANPEYVFELARSLREMNAEDRHVFDVEDAVRRILASASASAEFRE